MDELIRQISIYFLVGGTAAIVEWTSFFVLNSIISINYLLATILAFLLSTFSNWIIGKKTLFKSQKVLKNKFIELILVYSASSIGLIINLLLMFLFVDKLMINAMLAKFAATGMVFIWNFLIRKCYIYKI